MDLQLSRLRHGELIAGIAGAALLVCLLALPWYGTKPPISRTAALLGASTSFTGWQSLSQVRWLMLVTGLTALALVFFQATRRSPAIPVSLSVVLIVLAALAALALIYRVLINVPGPSDLIGRKFGSYLALASGLGVLYGGFASLRQEGILERDGPGEIPVVTLGERLPAGASSPVTSRVPATGGHRAPPSADQARSSDR